MSNKIRAFFAREVENLLPVLHETYRLIGAFQKERRQSEERKLLVQLDLVGEQLAFFKPYLQAPKRPYFDALRDPALSTKDRIIALDTAVGAMHIEFAMPRAYMHRESQALRRVLEQSRQSDLYEPVIASDAEGVWTGLAAAPGTATGKAFHVRRPGDYRRLPSGCIVVARMTRPDIIMAIEKISGLVTDSGGRLCHAAIIAREYRIPCVVGIGSATREIAPRTLICVDGDRGQVSKVR